MNDSLQARLCALRTFRVNARRNIQRSLLGISDDIDRRRFVELQQMILQGTQQEWEELNALVGRPVHGPVKLLPPAQRRRLPSTAVRATSRRTLDLPVVRIKSLDADERVITGFASTSSVDRIGDVVVPSGAEYTLPLPLLLDHEHHQQVGHVIEAKLGSNGIQFTAQIAKVDEPGAVREMVDRAWQLVKNRLRSSVSIGFLPRESEPLDRQKPYGGVRFLAWEWLELSLVSVPANAGATITGFKAAAA